MKKRHIRVKWAGALLALMLLGMSGCGNQTGAEQAGAGMVEKSQTAENQVEKSQTAENQVEENQPGGNQAEESKTDGNQAVENQTDGSRKEESRTDGSQEDIKQADASNIVEGGEVSKGYALAQAGAGYEPEEMEVHFIDVGQADATLIKCGGYSMLIDAAEADNGTAVQNYLQKQGVEKLDYLILTHPDSDHIGGAPVILTKFEVGQVFVSNFEKDNNTYRKLIQALDDKGLTSEVPEAGQTFSLGSAVCTVLAPGKEYDDPNNASIALLVQNGENGFLFTGDGEEEAEQDILSTGIEMTADVYKAGHHGSKTSTTEELLDAVNPKWAVISCGEGNEYGHPGAQTLNRFRTRGIEVYRTDEQGTIVAKSDGREITWNAAPSDTWKAGEPKGTSGQQSGGNSTAGAGTEGTGGSNNAGTAVQENQGNNSAAVTYVLNTNSKKFHRLSCSSLPTANRQDTTMSREEIIAAGYEPCKRCNP